MGLRIRELASYIPGFNAAVTWATTDTTPQTDGERLLSILTRQEADRAFEELGFGNDTINTLYSPNDIAPVSADRLRSWMNRKGIINDQGAPIAGRITGDQSQAQPAQHR